jgi:phospholipase C
MKVTFSSLFLFLFLIAGIAGASAFAQIQYPNPINRVVIIDQENRTVDNLLGSNSPANLYYLPGLNFSTTGLAYLNSAGKKTVFSVQLVPVPLASTLNSKAGIEADDYDPDHSHEPAWVDACDAPSITDPSSDCAMDGFNLVRVDCVKGAAGCPGPDYPTYAYVQYSDVAPYFQIASQYGYANNMFQTNQGPSFPSHQFTFSGTSQSGVGDEPTWFVGENKVPVLGDYGCIASSNSTVGQINPFTQAEIPIYPCFTHNTMADLFYDQNPKITWTYYTPEQGSLWSAPDAISTICTNVNGVCTGPYWTKGAANGYVDIKPVDVLTDIGKCELKQMNWIIPTGLESDHAGITDGSGPSWVADIVNKIGNSPCTDVVNGKTLTYWQDTVILITWDDWGGWYDHVVPPPVSHRAPSEASSYVYGFRVPLLVVSAYTPAGTVSNEYLDFGAMLKFVEEVFGNIGTISSDPFNNPYADEYAYDDLHEFFNFNQAPRSFQSIQAPIKEDVFLDPDRPVEPPDND